MINTVRNIVLCLLSLSVILINSPVLAQQNTIVYPVDISNIIPDNTPQVEPNAFNTTIANNAYNDDLVNKSEQAAIRQLNIKSEELARHPEVVVRALVPALLQNNVQTVSLVLPAYKKQANKDLELQRWGEAILARAEGNYTQAINYYRYVISKQPDVFAVRYQLAQTLYLNYENEAAIEQFEKLRAQNNNEQINESITAYISSLQNRQSWIFNGGFNYIYDKNINNAPKQNTYLGEWKAWDAESAQGLSYYINAEKKLALNKGYFNQFTLAANGRHFFDNSKYNELTSRVSAGIGYQDVKLESSILPFASYRWLADSEQDDKLTTYSESYGLQLNNKYWLNKHWQVGNIIEFAQHRYKDRTHLDGNSYFSDINILYIPVATQYWLAGINYYNKEAKDKDDAFNQIGGRVGWGQEWQRGLSTRAVVNYAQKRYLAPGRLLADKQVNDEWRLQLSLWHRNLHIYNFTPRVVFSYEKVDSNHPFFSYDKNNISIELNKRF